MEEKLAAFAPFDIRSHINLTCNEMNNNKRFASGKIVLFMLVPRY